MDTTTPGSRRPAALLAAVLAAALVPVLAAPGQAGAAGDPAASSSTALHAGLAHAASGDPGRSGSADSSQRRDSHDSHGAAADGVAQAASSRTAGATDEGGAAVREEAVAGEDATDFAFLSRTDPPARWDACDPVDWRLRTTGAPRDGFNHVVEAVRKVEAATGLRFRYLGESSFVPTRTQRTEPGVDLSIAWVEADAPDVWGSTPSPAGVGGASWTSGSVDTDGRAVPRISSGFVALEATGARRDDAWLDAITAAPAGWDLAEQTARVLASRRQVVLHELGHAVGLSHSTGGGQVMAPAASGVTEWAAGDLAGLARLGAATGCLAPTQAAAQAGRLPAPVPGPELQPWSAPAPAQAPAPSDPARDQPAGPAPGPAPAVVPAVPAVPAVPPLALPTLLPSPPATTPAAVPTAAQGPRSTPAAAPAAARPVRVSATGPSRVRRGAPAVLTVRGRPGDAFTLHVRRAGATTFAAAGTGRLDARGVGRVAFRPRVDHRWYVAVGPARTRTAVGLVRIVR